MPVFTIHHPTTTSPRRLDLGVVVAALLAFGGCDDGSQLPAETEGGDAESGTDDDGFRSLDLEPASEASSSSKSGIVVCGGSCPAGRHVAQDVCTSSCAGWGGIAGCISTGFGNAVDCELDQGSSFSSCEASCPPGYHINQDTCRSSCDGWGGIAGCIASDRGNSVQCVQDAGASFGSCEATCPPDYVKTADICSPSCDGWGGIGGCVATSNGNRIECTFAGSGCAWDPGTLQFCDHCGPCQIGEGQCNSHHDCAESLGCYGGTCNVGIAAGDLSASPETVPVSSGTGLSQISASVEFSANPQIWVSVNGAPSTLFAGLAWIDDKGGSTTQDAPWIQAGSSYAFTLYENGFGSAVLDTVTVVGEQACASNEYEFSGVCYPKPIVGVSNASGAACGNLGVSHGSPDYLVETTVTGRPGATIQMFNRQASCGTGYEVATDSGGVIPASGVWVSTIESAASNDCSFGGLYGRWSKYVVVDGYTSNTRNFSFYNSQCSQVANCGQAFNYCEDDGGGDDGPGGDGPGDDGGIHPED